MICKSVCKFGLLVVAMIAAGCSSAPPYASVEPALDSFAPFDIPLRVTEEGASIVVLDTSMGPLKLILDTGAEQALLLRSGVVDAAGLSSVGSAWRGTARGAVHRSRVFVLPDVQLGALSFGDVRAIEEGEGVLEGLVADGMVGRGLFGELTLDFDYASGRLGVLPPGVLPSAVGGPGWIEAPLVAQKDGPVVLVRLDDSEHSVRLVLDTGALAYGPLGDYGLVDLPADLEATPGEGGGPPVYEADAVSLGDGSIGPMPFFDVAFRWPPDTDGFLGSVLFRSMRVVLDPAGDRVFLKRFAAE